MARLMAMNVRTGAHRTIPAPKMATVERWDARGWAPCAGPCKCRVEPDGHCPNGWPSKVLVAGVLRWRAE